MWWSHPLSKAESFLSISNMTDDLMITSANWVKTQCYKSNGTKATWLGFYQMQKRKYTFFLFLEDTSNLNRSTRPEVFCKKGVLRNFAKFIGKHRARASLLKKRLWHRCFPVNFSKCLRTPWLIEYFRWLLLPQFE